MALSADELKTSYPLPVYNYRVVIGASTTMSFAEVSGLKVEYNHLTYNHGLSFLEGEVITSFYYDSHVPVTLKRGLVTGSGPRDLFQWLKELDTRRLEVSLCDESGEPVLTWTAERARPIKLEAPTFDANSNDVAIESLEVMARSFSISTP